MPGLGPLIPPRARQAGAVLVVGSLQFIVAMIVVQLKYPGYSDLNNYVSDLGNSTLSPWAAVFNASVIVLGLLTLLAAYLLLSAFNHRLSRTLGLGFLVVAGIGAISVGIFPENSGALGGNAHSLAALVAFVGAGLALINLPGAMLRDTRWDGYRGFTGILGLITLVAVVLYATDHWGALGPGGLERLIIAPILLWSIVAGIHLLSLPTYEKSPIVHSTLT